MTALRPSLRRAGIAAAALLPLLAAACGDTDPAASTPAPTVAVTVALTPTTRPAATTTTTVARPSTTSSSTTTTSTSTSTEPAPTTTIDPADVRRGYPIDTAIHTSFTPEAHANYRATDIFATTNCGTPLLSPVDGVVDEVLLDRYDRATDDPALRGGNAVSIIGDDGVRYYLAHFESFAPELAAGGRVAVGDVLGAMGTTGRSGACHVHVGLSLPCPGTTGDWWIRRGVIWPDRYLDAWKAGENLSPLEELQQWFAEYPDACRSVDDTPYPRA